MYWHSLEEFACTRPLIYIDPIFNYILRNYLTSCDPHNDMSRRIFGHMFYIF